jgi:hypothetical protein
MILHVATGFVSHYVEECLLRLSSRPNGSQSHMENYRALQVIKTMKALSVSSSNYAKGIVDQLVFEGRPPVHCLSACSTAGEKLYARHQSRRRREDDASRATTDLESRRVLSDQIVMEIDAARSLMGALHSSMSDRPFDKNWQDVLSKRSVDPKLKHLDLMGKIPSSFKYLASGVWELYGRCLPTVGEEYLEALRDDRVRARFADLFMHDGASRDAAVEEIDRHMVAS